MTSTIRATKLSDAKRIAEIYSQGIEERSSTFETDPRTTEDRAEWIMTHQGFHAVVAIIRQKKRGR